MREWVPEWDRALHRSMYRRSPPDSVASIGIVTVSPGPTDGRYGAPMQGCASPVPTEFLQAVELLSFPGADVQPHGTLGGREVAPAPKPFTHRCWQLSSCWLEASDMISKPWSSPQFAGPVGQAFASNVSMWACVEQGAVGCRATCSAGSRSLPFGMGEENCPGTQPCHYLYTGISIFSSVFSLCLIIRKILLALPAAAEQ